MCVCDVRDWISLDTAMTFEVTELDSTLRHVYVSFWPLNSTYLEKYCLLSNDIDSRGHFGSFWDHFGNAFPQW